MLSIIAFCFQKYGDSLKLIDMDLIKGLKQINFTSIQQFKEDIETKVVELKAETTDTQCFVIKPVNIWVDEAKKRPIPNMLFDVFWFENEICILFADTNVGKSILAVQIAESISSGKPIDGFEHQGQPQKVVYFDFELSDKQFEKRYSNNFQDHYKFSKNFMRAEIDSEAEIPNEFKCFEDFLIHSIISVINQYNPEVLIIDNITYLKSDNERAKDALPLMKALKNIGKVHGISILVLAHTPKRDPSKALTKNDLAGSKMLINFCDSAFAIGESSNDSGIRYLKQIKQRNSECVYNSENVAVCEILLEFNFLKFHFRSHDLEINHLKSYSNVDFDLRNQEIYQLHSQGVSNVKIAEQFNMSEGGIRKVLKKFNS